MVEESKRIAKQHKSWFKRIIYWLHLWLGILSGIVVLIVSITGCIYVFEKDIRNTFYRHQSVAAQQKPYLPPSQLKAIARQYAFASKPDTGQYRITGLIYGAPGKSAYATYTKKGQGFTMLYMNPYDGAIIKEKILNRDFFRLVLAGHYYLWLPPKIGHPVVAISVLIFVILLITGIIMWWPKNLKKANRDKSFKVKWKAGFKRVNYDLHNVLGFYVSLIALVIALTGLVWGFEWFKNSVYWVSSGGKALPEAKKLQSNTLLAATAAAFPEDKLYAQMQQEYAGSTGSLQIGFPQKASDVISITHNPDDATYYKREFRRFDQYTLKELKSTGVFAERFDKAAFADKLQRLNYDIHVGAVLGWPGKILAFFASLICASLPITGFLIWRSRWKKKKKGIEAKPAKKETVEVKHKVLVGE